jgi:hypothetical protein
MVIPRVFMFAPLLFPDSLPALEQNGQTLGKSNLAPEPYPVRFFCKNTREFHYRANTLQRKGRIPCHGLLDYEDRSDRDRNKMEQKT